MLLIFLVLPVLFILLVLILVLLVLILILLLQFLLCDPEVAPGIVIVRINAQRLFVVIYGLLILLHIEFHIAKIVVRLGRYAGTLLDISCRFGEILTGSLYQFLSLRRGILQVLHLAQL